jgi:hypothetical protein
VKALNIQIEDFQHEWIRRQAFERRMSMSDVVREIINKSMEEESKAKNRESAIGHTLRYEVIEDNAGGLHLFVFRGGEIVYAACGWERSPGVLRESLEELRRTGTAEGWEGMDYWDGMDTTPEESYATLHGWVDEGMGGAHIIADQDGIYPDRMGAAGKREFGRPRPTTAERIAKQLGNDGECWESDDGRDLDTLAKEAGAEVTYHDTRELTRYYFSDGSAIVAGVGGWDIEGDEPFSWAGAE